MLCPTVRSGTWIHPPSTQTPVLNCLDIGGFLCLSDVATILRRENVQSPPGTKCAIIFDSTPAPTTLPYAIRASMAAITGGLLQTLLGGAIISVLYSLTYAARALFRRPTLVTREMAAMNDPASRFLPWTSASEWAATPRMYLYSTADVVIPFRAVEGHAADARRAGFPVRMVNFETSAHVSHARDYPEKYWSAVQTFWEEAIRMGGRGGDSDGNGDTSEARASGQAVEVRAFPGLFFAGGWTKELRWSLRLTTAAPTLAASEALTSISRYGDGFVLRHSVLGLMRCVKDWRSPQRLAHRCV